MTAFGIATNEPLLADDGGRLFLSRLRTLGMTEVRVPFYREWWDRSDRPWLEMMDTMLAHAREKRIAVTVVLLGERDSVTHADARRAFGRWAAGFVTSFPSVRRVVIWNEPNLPVFWNGSPEEMADLLRWTWLALRRVRPAGLRISAMGLANRAPAAYARAVVAALAGKTAWHEVSFHPYPGSAWDSAAGVFASVTRLRRALPPGTILNLDELAWPAPNPRNLPPGETWEDHQAETALSVIARARREPKIRSVAFYRLEPELDDAGSLVWPGLLDNLGRKRSAWYAIRGALTAAPAARPSSSLSRGASD